MLYGYRHKLDNRLATIVSSADNVETFELWFEAVRTQSEETRNFEEIYTSTLLDHMMNENFKGYKHCVYAFYHKDDAQQLAFFKEWDIVELSDSAKARDKSADMMFAAKLKHEEAAEIADPSLKDRTIEQLTGLDKEDPWDRRTEKEKEEDRQMAEKIREMREAGKMSGDSFGGGKSSPTKSPTPLIKELPVTELPVTEIPNDSPIIEDNTNITKKKKPYTGVIDINATINSDGTVDIEDVLAKKWDGEVDQEVKKQNEEAYQAKVDIARKGERTFSPEDFAAALRGDGRSDSFGVAGDIPDRREGIPRPVFSPEAEKAREEHRKIEEEKQRVQKIQRKKEQDAKDSMDRDQGIFRGSELYGYDEQINYEDLPEKVRELIDRCDPSSKVYPLKDYPYNAELAGRSLLPFDITKNLTHKQILTTHNLKVEGSITIDNSGVWVVTKDVTTEPGWAIYAHSRSVPAEKEGEQPSIVSDVNIVRIR